MNEKKEQHTLYGRLLRPIMVGKSAVILANGQIYRIFSRHCLPW